MSISDRNDAGSKNNINKNSLRKDAQLGDLQERFERLSEQLKVLAAQNERLAAGNKQLLRRGNLKRWLKLRSKAA